MKTAKLNSKANLVLAILGMLVAGETLPIPAVHAAEIREATTNSETVAPPQQVPAPEQTAPVYHRWDYITITR